MRAGMVETGFAYLSLLIFRHAVLHTSPGCVSVDGTWGTSWQRQFSISHKSSVGYRSGDCVGRPSARYGRSADYAFIACARANTSSRPRNTSTMDGCILFVLQYSLVLVCFHRSVNVVEPPDPVAGDAVPYHDAATTVLDCANSTLWHKLFTRSTTEIHHTI